MLRRYHQVRAMCSLGGAVGATYSITGAGDVAVTAGTGTTCRIDESGAAWGVTAGIGSTYLIAGGSS